METCKVYAPVFSHIFICFSGFSIGNLRVIRDAMVVAGQTIFSRKVF